MLILPDVIKPGLKVIFCSTAVGKRSAEKEDYYAGRGNQFWSILFRVSLTPRILEPEEYKSLIDYGIGLTDLAKKVFGNDSVLYRSSFDVSALRNKIEVHSPRVLAFNGKSAAKVFVDHPLRRLWTPTRKNWANSDMDASIDVGDGEEGLDTRVLTGVG